MPIRENKLTNKPLNGNELAQVVMNNVERLLNEVREQILSGLDAKLRADALFGPGYGHPRVALAFSVKIQFANMNLPKTEIALNAGEGAPPLVSVPSDADHAVIAIDRTITIDSPNLTRLDEKLPFTTIEVDRPGPGEHFGKLREVEIPVSAEDYAHIPRTPVVESDNSDALAAQLKIPESQRLRPAQDRRAR